MKGKGYIAGGNGRAIVKTSAGINRDFHPGIVGGIAGMVGNQRIIAPGLIIRSGEQGIVERLSSYRGIAAQRVAVEVVEGADCRQGERATFRRLWIDIIKMAETGGVFGLADNREGDAFLNGLRVSAQAKQSKQKQKKSRIHRRQNTPS